ncbi:MAG: hypothetical protein KC466_12240 [Myxococcales bacterium]|nr:hypothetical protein [Myxococcales bacterium]
MNAAGVLGALKSDPILAREGDRYRHFDPLALLQHLGHVEGVVLWTHHSGVIHTLEAPEPCRFEVLAPRDDFCRYQLVAADGTWLPGHGHIRHKRIEKVVVEIHPDDCMPAAYAVVFQSLREPATLLTVGLPVWYDPNHKDRARLNEDALALYRFLRERLGTGVLRLGGAWYGADADLHSLAEERYRAVFEPANGRPIDER